MRVFKLISRALPKFILAAFYKCFTIATIFVEKCLEFFLGDRNIKIFFGYIPSFILYPVTANAISKKKSCELSAVVSVNLSHIKMIISLLA